MNEFGYFVMDFFFRMKKDYNTWEECVALREVKVQQLHSCLVWVLICLFKFTQIN